MLIRYRLRSFTAALIATAALFPAVASADPVTLTVALGPSLQQTLNRPCVIGDPSCHNKDVLPFTLIGPRMDRSRGLVMVRRSGHICSRILLPAPKNQD